MITYRRCDLALNVDYTLVRELPENAQIFVRSGEQVKPETLLAQGKIHAGFKRLNLVRELGLPAQKLKIVKTPGSRVYVGDVLVRGSKLWGIKQVEYQSPIDGTLAQIDWKKGVLTLAYLPRRKNIVAGIRGKVVRVIPGEKILVSSRVDQVRGLIGLGAEREGGLARVGKPDLPLEAEHLQAEHAQKIIFGGTRASEEFFQRALEIGVRGIILGGIDLRIFRMLSSRRGALEDVGFTLLVMGGFGNFSISPQVLAYLTRNQGRYAFLSGHRTELLLPTLPENKIALGPSRVWRRVRDFAVIKENQFVRVLVGPKAGQYGIVVGIAGQACRIKIGRKEYKVALPNLEIVQCRDNDQ